MTYRGIFGGLGKTLKWGVISLALIYGLLLAINAVDEDLTPEAKAFLVIPQINADPANGYLAFVGVGAPANEDIVNYGTQWVDAFNTAVDKAALEKAYARFPYSANLKFIGDEKQLCDPSKTPCLPQARKNADLWRRLAADNEMPLARLRRITEFPHFEESYFAPSFESPFALLGAPRLSRRLALDLIALDATEGRIAPALAALEAYTAFDRRALLGSRSLIMAMVSRSWLEQDYALLAEIIATRSTEIASQKARLVRMTEPLEIDQIKAIAKRMFEGEARTVLRWIPEHPNLSAITGGLDSESLLDVMAKPLFKPQATQNMQARFFTAFQERTQDVSLVNIDTWYTQAVKIEKSESDVVIYSWRFMYNPYGKFYNYEHAGFEPYVLRLTDLLGITRLARLQIEIVTAGKGDADIPARIATNKALYDPYTDKPMGWDADKRQLFFDAHGNYPKEISKHIQAGI